MYEKYYKVMRISILFQKRHQQLAINTKNLYLFGSWTEYPFEKVLVNEIIEKTTNTLSNLIRMLYIL